MDISSQSYWRAQEFHRPITVASTGVFTRVYRGVYSQVCKFVMNELWTQAFDKIHGRVE